MDVEKAGEVRPLDASGSPRLTCLPFFYSAPFALVVAGILLLLWGDSVVKSPFSPRTLALTHVITLGFLSMTAFGAFYLLATHEGAKGLDRYRLGHVVYYALVATLMGLAWGIARAESDFVFAAIGSAGVMGLVFIIHASRGLRGLGARSPTLRGLRLALWGFSLASFLGIWLAHGHGGMRFPGLRGLWMQVHFSIALTGWVGGLSGAAIGYALARDGGHDDASTGPLDSRILDRVILSTGIGMGMPFLLLFAGYFFMTPEHEARLQPFAAAATLPALIAIWGVHPVAALKALSTRPDLPGRSLWKFGFSLAPLVLALGLAAWAFSNTQLAILFGWVALVGWGGTLIYALLVGVVPSLLQGDRESPQTPVSSAELRPGLFLHGAVLVLGGAGVVSASDFLMRAAGLCLVADGFYLWVCVIRGLRGSRPRPLAQTE